MRKMKLPFTRFVSTTVDVPVRFHIVNFARDNFTMQLLKAV